MRSSSSAARMRSARTSRMRAFVCEVSVTMPACDPVSEIARWPKSLMTIAASAHDWRSPVDSNMSISRGSGWSETSLAISISWSVVLPRADSTATTPLPDSFAATIRRAARLMRSESATDVPPNFITTSWAWSRPGCAASALAWAGWAMALKDSFLSVRGPRRKRILIRQLTAILVLALIAGGTIVLVRSRGGGDSQGTSLQLPAATGNGDGPASHVSFLERLIPPPSEAVAGPRAPRSLADLARRLPLERVVAQLFLFGFTGKDSTAPIFGELKRLDLGGLVVDGGNYDSAQQLAGLTAELTAAASSAHHLPPFVMAEQDGGDYSQFADLPPTLAPGDYKTPADAAAAFTSAVTTLKALGVNSLLGPDLDVAAGDSAIGARAVSDDPATVSSYAHRTITSCGQLA